MNLTDIRHFEQFNYIVAFPTYLGCSHIKIHSHIFVSSAKYLFIQILRPSVSCSYLYIVVRKTFFYYILICSHAIKREVVFVHLYTAQTIQYNMYVLRFLTSSLAIEMLLTNQFDESHANMHRWSNGTLCIYVELSLQVSVRVFTGSLYDLHYIETYIYPYTSMRVHMCIMMCM